MTIPGDYTWDSPFGAPQVRSRQLGFVAETTALYNGEVDEESGRVIGYAWARLTQQGGEYAAPEFNQWVGQNAFDIYGRGDFPVGTLGWVEPDADTQSWVFIPLVPFTPQVTCEGSGSGGAESSCTISDDGFSTDCVGGDGDDPVAVRETLCVMGKLYVTTGRQQIVTDCTGRSRLSWYGLVTRTQGCCSCEDAGSGDEPDFGSGCGPLTGCCEDGDAEIPVALTGPFGEDCEVIELLGTATYSATARAWEGVISWGDITADVQVRCDNGGWTGTAILKTPECSYLVVSGGLTNNGEGVLEGTIPLGSRSDCPDAEAFFEVGAPCEQTGGTFELLTVPQDIPGGQTRQFTIDVPPGVGLPLFTVQMQLAAPAGVNQLTTEVRTPGGVNQFTMFNQPPANTATTAQYVISPPTGVSQVPLLTVAPMGVFTSLQNFTLFPGPFAGQWTVLVTNHGAATATLEQLTLCFGAVPSGLTLDVVADPESGTAPFTVELELTVGGTPYLYSVDWGDGSALEWYDSDTGIEHEFTDNDAHTVTVRAWSVCGQYVEDTVVVNAGVVTDCCPDDAFPTNMVLEFANDGTGTATCLNGEIFNLLWNGTLWEFVPVGTADLCGNIGELIVGCTGMGPSWDLAGPWSDPGGLVGVEDTVDCAAQTVTFACTVTGGTITATFHP